ncbi:precorrin-2 dehydrogenase/sirohydrochlorin ferrochelatase family protein [Desulfacinum hydrothermale]|uniref:precorrin-2 dehydrogenase/sirohydrochlorin ferrochelatase family protein n=1 Tax=Desulfacinum hydrothermale TaxID=109258 RepID=UPI00148209EB|nr:bifunctional precorrin-2 dehydrogenase/sirohydrochlorin ferrochelatase [Desulfacinum hydrothermale]
MVDRVRSEDFTTYCPLFLSLKDRRCVVVGAGTVAERKARRLLDHGAQVMVVARDLNPWWRDQVARERVTWVASSYEPHHLQGAVLVFAVTSDRALNRRVAEDARRLGLWCNTASDPQRGTCLVPASFRRGPLTIAVSTAGLSPAVSRLVREKLEKEFGPEWAAYLHFLGGLRRAVQKRSADSERNQALFRAVVQLPILEWIGNGRFQEIPQAVGRVLDGVLAETEIEREWERAWKASS